MQKCLPNLNPFSHKQSIANEEPFFFTTLYYWRTREYRSPLVMPWLSEKTVPVTDIFRVNDKSSRIGQLKSKISEPDDHGQGTPFALLSSVIGKTILNIGSLSGLTIKIRFSYRGIYWCIGNVRRCISRKVITIQSFGEFRRVVVACLYGLAYGNNSTTHVIQSH